jgi:raffinose/stachyose/melibiose transport system substrate-binding protein
MSLRQRSVVLLTAGALLLAGCSSDEGTGGSQAEGGGEKVTIDWWHIQNIEPVRPVWDAVAKEFMTANPNVTVKVTAMENEAFKAKMTTVAQSGDMPDIYQTWGGGVLAQHAEAGLAKDITDDIASWSGNFTAAGLGAYQLDGRTYGIPYDVGMIGSWYNKALFKKAGIEQPPATWNELLDAVKKLKEAGTTPIALAGKAKWPGHYWWSYLAMRIGGVGALGAAMEAKNFNTPDLVAAGQRLKELVDLKPFQNGFLGADYDTPTGQAATMGNGKAAMELMGQWAPTVQKDAGADLGEDLGFFTFPTVEGGKGAATEAFGGGGGFAVGKDAPAEAVEFLKYISSPDVRKRLLATNAILPVVKGEETQVTDRNYKIVAENLAAATGFQLYLDQAFPPAVGQQVNDSTAALFAGEKTPEQVVEEITKVAGQE